jgi:DNA (cytosine-5)-methyltransferase 1
MDTTKPVTHVSLCAGYGGIDLGLKRAIPNLRTIAFSEIEAFACANLVAKMEAGWLDAAPVWTDVKTFPWEEFRGKVDILSGGYPCQPFSAAGKRLGKDDPRHLWPWIADGIRVCRPAVCFFENVEGHISLGLREVIGELEEIGYRATWGVFSAAEVGAPHQRKRVFILAHRLCERGQLPNWWRFAAEQMPVSNGTAGRDELALAVQQGSQGSASEPLHTRRLQSEIGRGCDAAWPSRPGQPQFPWEPPRVVAYGNGGEPSQGRGNYGEVCGLSETQCQPEYSSALLGRKSQNRRNAVVGDTNGMGSLDDKQSTEGRKAATVAESSAGLAYSKCSGGAESTIVGTGLSSESGGGDTEGKERDLLWQTEPALGGDADGASGGMDYAQLCVSGDNRTDELRLLGNGVVPGTAERAFRTLIARFFP